jgi:SulP family sulfate permease
MLPTPALPPASLEKLAAVLPDAMAIALLGAIESLLSAVVADEMTGERHSPEAELVAQGVANVAAAAFGGFCVTGTIARTATNVRAGGRTPLAGMLHAVYLLVFLAAAGGLAAHVPLAALGGVLAVVAWTMADRHAVAATLQGPRGDAVALAATFLLTVFVNLLAGLAAGIAVSLLLRRLGGGGLRA